MPYNFLEFKNTLKGVENWLSGELSQIHAGRATPLVLDGVMIDVYGAKSSLSHVATITIEDPKTLKVSPWDKSHIKDIERAIGAANLGLSTAPDQTGVRVIFPELSSDRRQGLVKTIRERLEKARITMRQHRDEMWSEIQNKEKEGGMAEDDKFRAKEEMEKLIGECGANLEAISAKKEKEVLG